uniref:Ring finger protein 34b n=1 Tax=Poecilia mexicana TaxID=48701 RepID=A0A3B3WP31_9TELE
SPERRPEGILTRCGVTSTGPGDNFLNLCENDRLPHLHHPSLSFPSRIQYTCCDCKKSFCSLCTEVLESLRICATCHLLKATAFHRPRLMRLPVRDLRQYLLLRSISTDTCREKEDLVDLVLCHRAFEVEDPNTASLLSHIHRTLADSIAPPASELSAATLEESLSRSESPETNQDSDETTPVSLLNLDSSEQTPQMIHIFILTSPQTRHGAGASVSDISSVRDIKGLSVRQLKEILARNFVNYSGCCEKWELVERVNRLYREKEKNTNTCRCLLGFWARKGPFLNGHFYITFFFLFKSQCTKKWGLFRP